MSPLEDRLWIETIGENRVGGESDSRRSTNSAEKSGADSKTTHTLTQKTETDFQNAQECKSSLRSFPVKSSSTENDAKNGSIPGYFPEVILFKFLFYSALVSNNFPANWIQEKYSSTKNNCEFWSCSN